MYDDRDVHKLCPLGEQSYVSTLTAREIPCHLEVHVDLQAPAGGKLVEVCWRDKILCILEYLWSKEQDGWRLTRVTSLRPEIPYAHTCVPTGLQWSLCSKHAKCFHFLGIQLCTWPAGDPQVTAVSCSMRRQSPPDQANVMVTTTTIAFKWHQRDDLILMMTTCRHNYKYISYDSQSVIVIDYCSNYCSISSKPCTSGSCRQFWSKPTVIDQHVMTAIVGYGQPKGMLLSNFESLNNDLCKTLWTSTTTYMSHNL